MPETARPEIRALALVLAAFVALATLYSVVNPLFEAPDELWHYGFVKQLRSGQGLPVWVQRPELAPPAQEALQPPLYYALAAAATFWVPREDLATVVRLNPAGLPLDPATGGKRNFCVLLRPDRFPYAGEYLAAHLARLVSVALGALTIVATWLVARELAPARPAVWRLAAVVVALNPQFIFTSATVSNDGLAACLGGWGLLLAIRAARRPPDARSTACLGVVAGLGALAKLSDLGLVPLGIVALALGARGRLGLAIRHVAGFALVALALPSWWFVRNVGLYGDPLAFRAFVQASGGSGALGLDLPDPLDALWTLATSYWAVFGWLNVRADPAVYAGFHLLTAAGLVGLALWLRRAKGRPRPEVVATAVAALWVAMILAAFARYQLSLVAFHGRLLFPAISASGALLALGLASLPWPAPAALRRLGPAALGAAMGATALLVPFRYIAPAYAAPPLIAASDLAAISHPYYARFGEAVELLGYDAPRASAEPGGDLELSLYWRSARATDVDYVASVQLLDGEGRRLAQRDAPLGQGEFPTRYWQVGDALRETYRLRVRSDAAGPSIIRVLVAVYPPGQPPVAAADRAGQRLPEVVLARLRLAGPAGAAPAGPGVADFAGQIRLEGFSVAPGPVPAGGVVGGELRWLALRPPDADYTVFVQLLGPNGLVGQYDAPPRRGAYPTSLWQPGDRVLDDFAVPVRAGAEPGEYRLIAGLYELASGRRLATRDGDFVTLASIRVARP